MTKFSQLVKQEHTLEIDGTSFTVRRWPLGFYEFLQLKGLEGKQIQFKPNGDIKKVEAFGNYDEDIYIDQIVKGLSSWGFTDDNDRYFPVTRENVLDFMYKAPALAKKVLAAIGDFNKKCIDDDAKKN